MGNPELERDDPEMFELQKQEREFERQTFDLSQRYRTASRERKAEIKKEMQDAVAKHFEARQKRRNLQLKRLDEEIKRMKESIEKRQTSRDQIIGRRVQELTGEDTGLEF